MATDRNETPWDDFLSDFTLVLDSGERLKCHKKALANASPVLKTMFGVKMKEAKTNEMNMRGFTKETVTCFLRYVYAEADSVIGYGKDTLIVEKEFLLTDFGRLTPQLMRLAHMYEMEDLVDICEFYLRQTKPDGEKPWTAQDIQKLGADLDSYELKHNSGIWLATDAFQRLTCGNCNKETTKPEVLLKCEKEDCGLLTVVSGDVAMVLDKDGNSFLDGLPADDSRVSIGLA